MIPNSTCIWIRAGLVVNCFQNCIFTYDSQLHVSEAIEKACCELLSELYFYLWFPTRIYNRLFCTELWIAFRIVFLLMIPNIKPLSLLSSVVVNCFQNCIFTYDSQRPIHRLITNFVVNCFQNCIFTYDSQLKLKNTQYNVVVNCFQNCIFTYDSQQSKSKFL